MPGAITLTRMRSLHILGHADQGCLRRAVRDRRRHRLEAVGGADEHAADGQRAMGSRYVIARPNVSAFRRPAGLDTL
jgi:hypothetical protein